MVIIPFKIAVIHGWCLINMILHVWSDCYSLHAKYDQYNLFVNLITYWFVIILSHPEMLYLHNKPTINVTGEIGWLLKRIFRLCLQIDHDVTRGVKPK